MPSRISTQTRASKTVPQTGETSRTRIPCNPGAAAGSDLQCEHASTYRHTLSLLAALSPWLCGHAIMECGWEASVSTPQIAADSLSIVVPGIFKPLQLSPHSLFEQGLIGQADYDAREVELLLPNEVITFKVGAFQVHCQPDRLQVATADEAEFERLRDLMTGILRSLNDTKVSQLGINRSVHFFVSDKESWNAIGDSLVNNDIWGEALPLSGMRVAVFWGSRTDKFAGRLQVQVEPSSLFQSAVYVAYNDHYELTRVDSQPASREELQRNPLQLNPDPLAEKRLVAVEVLANNWRESMQRFNDVLESIARLGKVT